MLAEECSYGVRTFQIHYSQVRLGMRVLRRWFGTARVGFLWKRGAHVSVLQRELADAIRTSLTERMSGG